MAVGQNHGRLMSLVGPSVHPIHFRESMMMRVLGPQARSLTFSLRFSAMGHSPSLWTGAKHDCGESNWVPGKAAFSVSSDDSNDALMHLPFSTMRAVFHSLTSTAVASLLLSMRPWVQPVQLDAEMSHDELNQHPSCESSKDASQSQTWLRWTQSSKGSHGFSSPCD